MLGCRIRIYKVLYCTRVGAKELRCGVVEGHELGKGYVPGVLLHWATAGDLLGELKPGEVEEVVT